MANPLYNDNVPSREAPKSKPLNQAGKASGSGSSYGKTLSKLERKEISFPKVAEEGKFKDINS